MGPRNSVHLVASITFSDLTANGTSAIQLIFSHFTQLSCITINYDLCKYIFSYVFKQLAVWLYRRLGAGVPCILNNNIRLRFL
jgi:hypothetical protein